MPSYEPPADQFLIQTLASHEAQLRALAAQQQSTITDELGRPVLNIGLIPGSDPAQYGLQFLDPASGQPRMFIGSTSSGAVVEFYDATGAPVVELGPSGLAVLDDTGVTQVMAGLLNASPAVYGLGVLPAVPGASGLQRVGGVASQSGYSASNVVSNGVWTALGSAPALSVNLGPSGLAKVTISGTIATNGSGVEGFVGVSANGGATYSLADVSVSGTGAGALITSTGSAVFSAASGAVANATNSFQLQMQTANASSPSNTVSFDSWGMTIEPL
ncbi:hypothetical protein [Haloactinopolyspora sp.]|uniref:hypothetical protein n=1 Tax=Haloactinopolyspora sp. TaxID=1966353 RepID=UPI0026110BCD|nr:hypothetical protein [Haloactinopolyspora sp.]